MAESEEHLTERRAARAVAVTAYNAWQSAVHMESAAASRAVAATNTKNEALAAFDAAETTVETLEAEAAE